VLAVVQREACHEGRLAVALGDDQPALGAAAEQVFGERLADGKPGTTLIEPAKRVLTQRERDAILRRVNSKS